MKDINVVGQKMMREGRKMANSLICLVFLRIRLSISSLLAQFANRTIAQMTTQMVDCYHLS